MGFLLFCRQEHEAQVGDEVRTRCVWYTRAEVQAHCDVSIEQTRLNEGTGLVTEVQARCDRDGHGQGHEDSLVGTSCQGHEDSLVELRSQRNRRDLRQSSCPLAWIFWSWLETNFPRGWQNHTVINNDWRLRPTFEGTKNLADENTKYTQLQCQGKPGGMPRQGLIHKIQCSQKPGGIRRTRIQEKKST